MISIYNLSDLERFGIYPLTGEACRIGQRILCDLDDNGRKVVADLFGIIDQSYSKYRTFPANWNGRNGASASFMLPYGCFVDLATWCLIHKGCIEIMVVRPGRNERHAWDTEVIGLEAGDRRKEFSELKALYDSLGKWPSIVVIKNNHPGDGTRATHAMSDRTT